MVATVIPQSIAKNTSTTVKMITPYQKRNDFYDPIDDRMQDQYDKGTCKSPEQREF